MSDIEEQLSLSNRIVYCNPRKPVPGAEPKLYWCAYCVRELLLLPHEYRLCQAISCIERAIADRKEMVFDLQISLLRDIRQLSDEKSEMIHKIAELEIHAPHSLELIQYRGLLSSLTRNLNFDLKNDRQDMILALESQIGELAKRRRRPAFPDDLRHELWERDKQICYLCRKTIAHWDGANMHIDHVAPRSKGGSDDVHNLRIAHPACNLKKGDRELSARRMKAILKELQKTDEEIKKGFLF